jgi:NADH-quinone oxidoreductase subunit J
VTGDLIFYAFAVLTVISGCFVVFSRNIVHAAFSLLFTLFGVAGLYAVLGADFLAVTQVVVYIGGILVLVLFAVMMTRMPKRRAPWRGFDGAVLPGIFSLGLAALLLYVIFRTDWPARAPAEPTPTIARIGAGFLTDYIFPFEYVSLVLLVAMIGAAILIRERRLHRDDLERSAAGGAPAGDAAAGQSENAAAEAGEVHH